MTNHNNWAFADVIDIVEPRPKPRRIGLTEIRDPALGSNQLEDLVSMMGEFIDSVKWTCGAQRLVDRDLVMQKHAFLKTNAIGVSTGGLLERVILNGDVAVHRFLDECVELGFTIVEISTGITVLPLADKLRLITAVKERGLVAKPEVGMSYGMRSATTPANANKIIGECQACLDAGADIVMIEEEGLFDYVDPPEYGVVHQMARSLDVEKLMFEASEFKTITWLLEQFGADVNLFVDPGKLAYTSTFRTGLWGSNGIWGRMASFGSRD
jgi:phosphosulfolactate synthase (CoM biosynthesis protein A)